MIYLFSGLSPAHNVSSHGVDRFHLEHAKAIQRLINRLPSWLTLIHIKAGRPDRSLFAFRFEAPTWVLRFRLEDDMSLNRRDLLFTGTGAAATLAVPGSTVAQSAPDTEAPSDGPKWFQLYIPRDRGFAKEMLQRAKAAGYKALVVTADVDVTRNRERSVRLQGAALPI
jgi:hypothetical protein